LRYRVISYSKDVSNAVALGLAIDNTPWIELDLDEPAMQLLEEAGLPLREAWPGDTLTFTFTRTGFAAGAKGVMAIFLHNPIGRRVQLIPVSFHWPYRSYLPSVVQ
ncbi:MAG TPA: hypothetical protein VNK95_04225, partial [Caldilineaceae bacterium]|nr:hypothetical protein [Caldilineaceae bacterium]